MYLKEMNGCHQPEVVLYKLGDETVRYYNNSLSCGEPGLVGDEREELVLASEILGGGKEDVYIAEILGDSMIGAGLSRGDQVAISTNIKATHGDIVLAMLGDEILLKFLMLDEDGNQWLVPANDAYKPILLDLNNDTHRILGVMTKIVKDRPKADAVIVKRFQSFVKDEYKRVKTTDDVDCPFHKYIPNNKDKKRVMDRLHNLLDGQEGVTVVKILKAAEHLDYLTRIPTQGDVEKEFDVNITHSVFYKAKGITYSRTELEPFIDSLT